MTTEPITKQRKGNITLTWNDKPLTPVKPKEAYTHRCTICGRTDVSHPDLEFRYCSRCNGYHCYCIDHINNHEHIQ